MDSRRQFEQQATAATNEATPSWIEHEANELVRRFNRRLELVGVNVPLVDLMICVQDAIDFGRRCTREPRAEARLVWPPWEAMAHQFIPKRACEGAATIDDGDMRECPHPQCGVRVVRDMADHPLIGFTASCPLRGKSPVAGRASVAGAQVEDPRAAEHQPSDVSASTRGGD